jgi:hypothetical protein
VWPAVGQFPHEKISGSDVHAYIAPDSDRPMRRLDGAGLACHWIAERCLIDFVHRARRPGIAARPIPSLEPPRTASRQSYLATISNTLRRSIRVTRPPHVTAAEVARRAGTSVAVVSYVMNDGPRPIAAETRDRVRRAALELGYRPNRLAGALRTGRSGFIGLVVPNTANPYFGALARAIERAADEAGPGAASGGGS